MRQYPAVLCVLFSLVVSASAPAAESRKPLNIAKGARVTASSTLEYKPAHYQTNTRTHFSASNITDGEMGTRWMSDEKEQQWVSLDLGRVEPHVNAAVIEWEVCFSKRYEVFGSADGATWKLLASVAPSDGGRDELFFETTPLRYFKVESHEKGQPWGTSIYEIGLYENLPRDAWELARKRRHVEVLRTENFDNRKPGKLATGAANNEWIHIDEGEVEISPAANGSGNELTGAGRWGGGINLLLDEALEPDSQYEIRIRARVQDPAKPVDFWSNCVQENHYAQLAGSNLGEGFSPVTTQTFTTTTFRHFTPRTMLPRRVLQIEYRMQFGGRSWIDDIEIVKITDDDTVVR